jgi:hypothetical protein
MIARVFLVVLSVLALAWLGVLLRDQRVGDHAFDRLAQNRHPTRESFAPDLQRLKDAELLTPDSTWQLDHARFLVRTDPARAARELEVFLKSEPDNLAALSALAVTTPDRRRQAQVVGQIRRVDPLGTR